MVGARLETDWLRVQSRGHKNPPTASCQASAIKGPDLAPHAVRALEAITTKGGSAYKEQRHRLSFLPPVMDAKRAGQFEDAAKPEVITSALGLRCPLT